MNNEQLIEKINKLKKEKNAVILSHNYEPGEIQDIADFVGDSLELAKKVINVDADIIVFCGVKFMAEMAYILNPSKKVLLPVKTAGCYMADTITAKEVRELRTQYPEHTFMGYVNTNADVKAEIDICCTSANAMIIAKNLPNDKIYYLPDRNLGNYLNNQLDDKKVITWKGCCNIHDRITKEEFLEAKEKYPDAELIVHPECKLEVLEIADQVLSTGGMVKYVKNSDTKKFLVGTENGMIYRLKKEAPDKEFYPVSDDFVCPDMKKINLEDLLRALENETEEVIVPEDIRIKAKCSLDEMLKYL